MKWFLVLAAIVFSGTAQASIGSITEFAGAATIKRGSTVLAASKGAAIEQNDRVETRDGKLKITFQDATTVSVAEHSALVIDDFVYDPASAAGKLGLRAAGGTVRYVSGAIAHRNPNAVNIRTPTAAIAVRGTDFVMSVNEIGSSMIILMPSCEETMGPVACGSGAIDVESGPNTVSMNRPYQATLVESAGQAPTPPITVNLFATPVGNNLQISPPKTMSGANVVAAARAAAASVGVTVKSDNVAGASAEEQVVAAKQDGSAAAPAAEEKTVVVQTQATTDVTVTEDNPYLSIIWADPAGQTIQIGWQYEILSTSKKHYANIILPEDTRIQVVVTQDGETNGYMFTDPARGQIVINQRAK